MRCETGWHGRDRICGTVAGRHAASHGRFRTCGRGGLANACGGAWEMLGRFSRPRHPRTVVVLFHDATEIFALRPASRYRNTGDAPSRERPRLAVVHARALYRPVPPVEFDDDGHPCRDGCTEGGRYPDRRARGAAAVGRSMMFRAGSGRRNAVDALGCRGRLGGDRGHRANGCVLTTRPAIAR